MSAQGGTWRFGASAVDHALIATLEYALAGRGVDGGGRFVEDGLAMAFRALHPARQGAVQPQPFRSREGLVVTFDGRLDNRADLVSLLRPGLCDERSDAAVVIAAYAMWGLAAFERLIGDWALSLWDGRQQRLLLARDYSGVRPLYYEHTVRGITWASELEHFLQLEPGRRSLDDEYLTRFLVADPRPDTTPYVGIHAVPPGSCVIVADGAVKTFAHWRPDPGALIRYSNDADYEEHFRELFRASVRNRVSIHGPVWAELSGGLDSSSIVCMADELARAGELPPGSLTTVSYVFEEAPTDDERRYILMVEAQRGARGRHLSESEYSTFTVDDETAFFSRPVPVPGRMSKLASAMKRASTKALLSGTGGDAVMWSSTRACPYITDLCSSGRWRDLHRALLDQCQSSSRSYLDVLWRHGLRPLAAGGKRGGRPTAPEWLVAGVPEVEDDEVPLDRDLALSQCVAYRFIRDAVKVCSSQYLRTFGHLIPSFPFLDRRLVQFMLAVPFEQKVRHGVPRSLHRRAMTGILPPEIAARRDKGGTQETICRAVRREWSRLASMLGPDARVVQRGYVRQAAMSATLQRVRAGLQADLFPIVRLLGLEVWLRHLDVTYPQAPERAAINRASADFEYTPGLTAKRTQHVGLAR